MSNRCSLSHRMGEGQGEGIQKLCSGTDFRLSCWRMIPSPKDSPSATIPEAPAAIPELLAPAGDWDCARAAVENGADAIYFGLDAGFNARARATNFPLDQLDGLLAFLHGREVNGYVTLNTLAFSSELAGLEDLVRRLAPAGVDALLVQDLGLARLVREICPDLPIHASTQMTLTSAETIEVARTL